MFIRSIQGWALMILVAAPLALVAAGFWIAGAAGSATYSFGGTPASPLALSGQAASAASVLTAFDVQVHSRDSDTWYALESMQAQHGADCGAPPATHENHTYEGAVFQCKDHVMTSIKAGGYGEIILTPDAMADFSAGTATVSWDVSTLRQSGRDWFDVWLTPFAENLPLPLESWLPDLNGPPRNAVHVPLGPDNTLCPTVYRNFQESPLVAGYGNGCNWWTGYETILTPSATVRTTFRIEVSQTNLKVWIPPQPSTNNQSLVWFDGPIPGGLPFNKAVVQFGHHSYNPEKRDGCGVGSTPCEAGTWHWDNLSLSPSVPFTMIKAQQRFANAESPAVTFNAPAPANAYLRFSGHESKVEASFNGGPYQALTEMPNMWALANNGEFGQFFAPVPAGTTSVAFRVQPGWTGSWILQDFAIWTQGASTTADTATATRTAPATPGTATSTPSSATATATATRTVTPISSQVPATATPTRVPPTMTTTATRTATPVAPAATPTRPPAPPPAGGSFLISGSVSTTVAAPGSRVLLTASATSSSDVTAIVDVQLYSPSGRQVYEKAYEDRPFAAGVTRTFGSYWTVPEGAEKGTYVLKVGVFKPGWAGLISWKDLAASTTVR